MLICVYMVLYRYPDCQGIANWVAADAGDAEAALLLRQAVSDSTFDEHMA